MPCLQHSGTTEGRFFLAQLPRRGLAGVPREMRGGCLRVETPPVPVAWRWIREAG